MSKKKKRKKKTVTEFCEFSCFFVECEGGEENESKTEWRSPWVQTLQRCGRKDTETPFTTQTVACTIELH